MEVCLFLTADALQDWETTREVLERSGFGLTRFVWADKHNAIGSVLDQRHKPVSLSARINILWERPQIVRSPCRASAGDDLVLGGSDDDILAGGDGKDRAFGGAGDDFIYFAGQQMHVNGGSAFDTARDQQIGDQRGLGINMGAREGPRFI